MNYSITYAGDSFRRLLWAVIADSRVDIPAVKNQPGTVIESYVNSLSDLVVPGVLFYKVETAPGLSAGGNLAGYFTIQTSGTSAILYFSQLRPAFVTDSLAIYQQIGTFINEGAYAFDYVN